MTYEEARAFIAKTATYGYRLGLDCIREMLRRLGNPQDDLKFIHIAGTNGKGSVLAYTSTVLKEAGYKVGRYISPTIYSYRERIQVNEEYISKEDLARLTRRIYEAGQAMVADGFLHPTCFEVETVLAFLYFQEQKCDLVVLETGMGGLTDATNVVSTTLVSVLVSISMDHMGYLGDTLAEIAAMKAGIIKPRTAVVSAHQQKEAARVIACTCQEKESTCYELNPADIRDVAYGYEKQTFSYKQHENLEISLAGAYQIENAALAVEVLDTVSGLGYPVPEEALREGLKKTTWNGRFTIVDREPLFIVDGAHNRDAADRLKEALQLYFKDRRLIFIMGVLADKDYEYIAKELAPLASQIVTIMTPDNPRALPAEALAETVSAYNPNVQAAAGLREAVQLARAAAGPKDVIVAFGSLSYLGELSRYVKAEEESV
ncbi:MAG: bifunctional folylpolyglutamate synthase/dihydrofolate synthase [Lachnospiraceae bacterium]|nr:bifunctional folylpolyglutamate synthase/dihydrofolate synthase [Lachnospiraceae bacterium]